MPVRQGLYDPRNEHDACGVGFIAHIKNRKSHAIVADGIRILLNLAHRGAVAADPLAGDGAGLLIQLPDKPLRAEAKRLGFSLPKPGQYGIGMMFLPRNPATRRACEETLEYYVQAEGQRVLGWRDVPVDSSVLGESIKPVEPVIRQIFIARGANCEDIDAFERKLFVIRKQTHLSIRARRLPEQSAFQGDGHSRAPVALLRRCRRQALRIRAGLGACAFFHQHLPVLGAGASLPLHRA
jgi:glutamate synthase (NADPH) large chain